MKKKSDNGKPPAGVSNFRGPKDARSARYTPKVVILWRGESVPESKMGSDSDYRRTCSWGKSVIGVVGRYFR